MRWSAVALLFVIPRSAAESPDLHPRLTAATPWVRTTREGVGAGWLVDRDRRWLVTCLHLVGDRPKVEAFFPAYRRGRLIAERRHYVENQAVLHDAGFAVWGKVIVRRPQADLALVELEKVPKVARALRLSAKPAAPGDRVWSVGHRHDAEALWVLTEGAIRQTERLADGYFWHGRRLANDVPALWIQSPVNSGDSGSALVNRRGEVVGVVSAVRWQASGTAVAIDVTEVRALLADAGMKDQKANGPSPPAKGEPALYERVALATGWVRPAATEARTAGWVIERERRLLITNARGLGNADVTDVVFPRLEEGKVEGTESAYADRLGLRLRGDLVRGVVLARDPRRDLALVQCESLPKHVRALALSAEAVAPGAHVHTVGHPTGVEWLWLYAAGPVRQTARVQVGQRAKSEEEPLALLLQLPPQGGGGGAVVNDRGEVCGVLVANEAAQQQLAYAVAASEVRAFLDSGKRLWDPTTADDYRERGRYLLRLGLAKSALEAFTEAARQSDSSPGDCRLLASAYLRLGNHERARFLAARAVAGEPRSAPGQVLLAEAVLAAGDTAAALKHCDDAIRLDPKHAEALAVRGESLRLLGQADEALKTWEEAIWLAPGCAAAYRLRGRHFERTGDRDKALHDYGRAAELEPTNPAPLRRRAAILLEVKEWKKAAAECERLLEVAPVDAEAFLQLGRAWLGFGDDAKALTAFTSAARLAPDGLRGFVAAAYKHADDLAARRPGDPERPAEWLGRVLASLRAVERKSLGVRAARFATPLANEKEPRKRLELLRSALNSLEGSDR